MTTDSPSGAIYTTAVDPENGFLDRVHCIHGDTSGTRLSPHPADRATMFQLLILLHNATFRCTCAATTPP